MKKSLYTFIILAVFSFYSCEENNTAEPGTTAQNEAEIDGETFTPTNSSAIKTNEGIILSFSDASQSIEITTNDTVEGSYTVVNGTLKTIATLEANAMYTAENETYTGESGLINIAINANRVIEGEYEIIFSNNDTSVSITGGEFTDITLSNSEGSDGDDDSSDDNTDDPLNAGKLKEFKWEEEGWTMTTKYYYTNNGKLIEMLTEGIESDGETESTKFTLEYDSQGRLSKWTEFYDGEPGHYWEYSYQGNKMYGDYYQDNENGNYSIDNKTVKELNASGQVISETNSYYDESSSSWVETDVVHYTWENNNITKYVITYDTYESTQIIEYDDKNNPNGELAVTMAWGVDMSINPSKNNPVKFISQEDGYEITYQYTYNANGYPVSCIINDDGYTYQLTYSYY